MKKRIRYIVALIVVAAVAVSCICVAAVSRLGQNPKSGSDKLVVKVSDASVKKGDSFDVSVNLQSNPGLISMKLTVEYDSTYLTLVGADDMGKLGDHAFASSFESPYTMLWSNGSATENITVTGNIATLHFKANDNYTGEKQTEIKVSAPGSNDIFNINMSRGSISLESVNGTVSVRDFVSHSIRAEKSAAESGTGKYQSAGLRFRTSVDDADFADATEIGFAVIRSSDAAGEWYKKDSTTAGVISAYAYNKQDGTNIVYNDADGYTEYQLILTGLTRDGVLDRNLKNTSFSVYMWIRYSSESGREEYEYIDLGAASYASVFEEYKGAGIDTTGY